MAWGESAAWLEGQNNERLYQRLLDDAQDAPSRNARRKKIVRFGRAPPSLRRANGDASPS
jgi:hypothetical protein